MSEKTVIYCFNPSENRREAFDFDSQIIDGKILRQWITLHSYGNSSAFYLTKSFITPEKLRELADKLEIAIKESKED